VNVVDASQRTCLFYAAQAGLVDTIRRLLDVRQTQIIHLAYYFTL